MKKFLSILTIAGVFFLSSCSSKSTEEQAAEAPAVDETEMLEEAQAAEEPAPTAEETAPVAEDTTTVQN